MRSRLPRQPVLASNSSAAQPSISSNAWSARTNAVSSLTPSHWRGHSLHKELLLLVERSEAQNFWAFFILSAPNPTPVAKLPEQEAKCQREEARLLQYATKAGKQRLEPAP